MYQFIFIFKEKKCTHMMVFSIKFWYLDIFKYMNNNDLYYEKIN